VADDACEVTVFRELEVDVALFPLGARDLPGVTSTTDKSDIPTHESVDTVELVLKLIMQS